MSTQLDWDLTRGDTDELPFVVTVLGSTDITGSAVRMGVEDTRVTSGVATRMTPVLLANVAAGGAADQIEITDGAAGELSVYIDDSTFATLDGRPGEIVRLAYDLEVLRLDGVRKSVAHGHLLVRIDVTV